MSRINIKNRKEFKIWEIFEITRWKRFVVWKHIEWNTPYYSASLECNWITDYISNPIFTDRDALVVTTFWNAFYAEWEFTASDEITILHHKNLNKFNWLFIATAITANKRKYSFKIKAFFNRVSNDYIKLPIDNEWNPDRKYMENYMKNLEEKCKTKLQNLILARGGVVSLINTNLWKEFKVWDLFEISSPSPRSQNNYEDWEVPFVASWDVNNWILKYCNPKNGENLDSWNCITVSPVDWSSFYQEENFLGRWWAGSSIMILRNDNLNKYCWLFIAWIIRKCCNFTYNDMWNREKLKNLIVKFPVNSEWNPNRDFMESYMKNLMEKNREKLKCLN